MAKPRYKRRCLFCKDRLATFAIQVPLVAGKVPKVEKVQIRTLPVVCGHCVDGRFTGVMVVASDVDECKKLVVEMETARVNGEIESVPLIILEHRGARSLVDCGETFEDRL